MELFIKVQSTGEYNDGGLDLDDVWDGLDSEDEQSLFEVLVCHVALFAIEQNVQFGQVVGFTFDHDGDEMEIEERLYDPSWIWEVAQLVAHIKGNRHYAPDGAIFARIKDQGWNYVDFGSELETMEDEYYSQFSGDYDEFAREYMESVGEELLSQHEYYFDYSEYGESLIDDYDRVEWNRQEYLFTQ